MILIDDDCDQKGIGSFKLRASNILNNIFFKLVGISDI